MSTKAQLEREFPPGTVVQLPSDDSEWSGRVGVIGRWTTTPRAHVVLPNDRSRRGYEVVIVHPTRIEATGETDESQILDAGNVCLNSRIVYRETRQVAARVIEDTRRHVQTDCGTECEWFGPANDRGYPFGGGRCAEFLETMLKVNSWYSTD